MRTKRARRAAALCAAAAATAALAPVAPAEPISEPGPGLVRHFSFFRTAVEGVPPELAGILTVAEGVAGIAHRGHGCPGLNPALAQRIPTTVNRLWVVPGAGCLVVASSYGRNRLFPLGIGSSTTRGAVRHGIGAGSTGLVPDGVVAARLSRTLTVPVTHNVYYFSPAAYALSPAQIRALWGRPKLIHGATASGR